jgi:hypothetical protein
MFAPSEFTFRRLRDDTVVKEWRSHALHLTARIVCEQCNSGWMSELEDEVKSVANGMIRHGTKMLLPLRAAVAIATFSFKNALVADCLRRDRVSFFEAPTRYRFAQTLQIPTGVKIWLAEAERPSGLLRPSYHEVRGTPFEVYAFTYIAGHLACQVVALKWGKTYEPDPSIPDFRQTGWDDFATPIWPADNFPVSWPPPKQLSGDLVEKFCNRWSTIEIATV